LGREGRQANESLETLRYAGRGVTGLLLLLGVAACAPKVPPLAPDAKPAIPKIRVGDVDLHYVDRGRGVPVIFVHGTLGSLHTFAAQLEAFFRRFRPAMRKASSASRAPLRALRSLSSA
jgi:hypothetical protein